MGLTELTKRLSTWGDLFKLVAVLIGAVLAAIGLFATIAIWIATLWWQANRQEIREQMREFLGIAELSMLVTGEDRILQTRAIGTQAISPVSQRDPVITATFSIRRTLTGAPCIAQGAIPMFEGQNHIPRPGILLSPIQQVGRTWQPVEVQAQVPGRLALGQAWMWIKVTYSCGGVIRSDETDAVAFQFTR